MLPIERLTSHSSPTLTAAARGLFRDYGAFLAEIQACHAFDFPRFDQETLDLPCPYTLRNGDLLLALAAPDTPVGCIAFRAHEAPPGSPPADPHTCELKRLFVFPAHRGQGIAEHLVLSALDHARHRGYRTAILDTEPSTMQAAQHLYRKLGFTEYTPAIPLNTINVLYLRKHLLTV